MAQAKKKGLGRGLGALIAPGAPPVGEISVSRGPLTDRSQLIELDPRKIRPNPHQPRQSFDEERLLELADSIRRDGVQEPVLLRHHQGEYQLVSGERRVRACVLAELERIPAIIRDVSDHDMLRLGLIENIQREDLNPIETARAYQTLQREFRWTQEELAAQVGKQRATVANSLRLLNLPPEVQRHVMDGTISMGHARAILGLNSADKQHALCRRIIAEGLSVRQAERLASPSAPSSDRSPPKPPDAHVAEIQNDLQRRLGTRVKLRVNPQHRGKIEIDFFNLDDLDRILAILRAASD